MPDYQDQRWSIEVEVRTVNNRHLKLSAKISEPYAALESELEHLVREKVRRGTVQISVRVDRPRQAEDYRLNAVALRSYRDQLRELLGSGLGAGESAVEPGRTAGLARGCRGGAAAAPATRTTTGRRSPAWSPRHSTSSRPPGPRRARPWPRSSRPWGVRSTSSLGRIADRGPLVVQSYQKRLIERIAGPGAGPGGDRRAQGPDPRGRHPGRSQRHLRGDRPAAGPPRAVPRGPPTTPRARGRKLEFVVQEMGREINTIGSKASDVEISRNVVEIKGASGEDPGT